MEDEGWHLNSAVMVANGLVPYRDFFWNQPPLFPYLYSLPQMIFGPSLLVARLTSVVIGAVALLLLTYLARRLSVKNSRFFLLVPLLYISNIIVVHYFSWAETHALVTLCIAASLTCFYYRQKSWWAKGGAIFFIISGFATKASLFPAVALIPLAIILDTDRRLKTAIFSAIVALASLVAFFGCFLVIAPQETIYDIFTWNIERPFTYLSLQAANHEPSMAFIVWNKFKDILDIVQTFFVSIAIVVVSFVLFLYTVRRRGWKEIPEFKLALVCFIVGFAVEAVHLRMFGSFPEYRLLELPFFSAAALVVLGKLYCDFDMRSKKFFFLFLSVLFFVSPLAGAKTFFLPPVQALTPQAYLVGQSHIRMLQAVGTYVRKSTHPEERILTWTPHYAAYSGRKLITGMEYETNSFFPTWSRADSEKHHFINKDMLLDAIRNKKAGIIILDQRFFQEDQAGAVLNPYRSEILNEILKNYQLDKEFIFHEQLWRNHAQLYVPSASAVRR